MTLTGRGKSWYEVCLFIYFLLLFDFNESNEVFSL